MRDFRVSHLEYGNLLSHVRYSDTRISVHTDTKAIAYRGPGIDPQVEPANVAQVNTRIPKA